MLFKSEATVITRKGSNSEENYHECLLNVKLIEKTGKNAFVYDKELGRNFEDLSAVGYIYEVGIGNVQVELCRRLQKSSDFVRKLHYRFDWTQLRLNTQGKVLKIENAAELKQRWQKLKDFMLKDYEGDIAENFLQGKDLEFKDTQMLKRSVLQYYNLGLLFPGIPLRHGSDWMSKKKLSFRHLKMNSLKKKFLTDQ